jgi:hypothetical protein
LQERRTQRFNLKDIDAQRGFYGLNIDFFEIDHSNIGKLNPIQRKLFEKLLGTEEIKGKLSRLKELGLTKTQFLVVTDPYLFNRQIYTGKPGYGVGIARMSTLVMYDDSLVFDCTNNIKISHVWDQDYKIRGILKEKE